MASKFESWNGEQQPIHLVYLGLPKPPVTPTPHISPLKALCPRLPPPFRPVPGALLGARVTVLRQKDGIITKSPVPPDCAPPFRPVPGTPLGARAKVLGQKDGIIMKSMLSSMRSPGALGPGLGGTTCFASWEKPQ